MSAELKKNEKMILKKIFFMFINDAVSEKTMENVRNHSEIQLVTKGRRRRRRRKYLVSKPSYRTTKVFPENLLAIKIKRTDI